MHVRALSVCVRVRVHDLSVCVRVRVRAQGLPRAAQEQPIEATIYFLYF